DGALVGIVRGLVEQHDRQPRDRHRRGRTEEAREPLGREALRQQGERHDQDPSRQPLDAEDHDVMTGHDRASGRTITWQGMGQTVLEILIAPALVAVATLVGRRWGARTGGLISAFPAVVGPVLLIIAQQRGDHAAARAASATLLGLVALSGFALAYARAAGGTRWPASLAAGWVCAIAAAGIAGWLLADAGLSVAMLAAVLSLALARRALPRSGSPHQGSPTAQSHEDIVVRMALTAALIILLTVLSNLFGPLVGGMLAALPVLASVLAVFTHRAHGSEATIGLLAG